MKTPTFAAPLLALAVTGCAGLPAAIEDGHAWADRNLARAESHIRAVVAMGDALTPHVVAGCDALADLDRAADTYCRRAAKAGATALGAVDKALDLAVRGDAALHAVAAQARQAAADAIAAYDATLAPAASPVPVARPEG